MIALIALIAFAAAAGSDASVPNPAAFFFRCELSTPADVAIHQLDLTYFEPAPDWAMGFNFRDPDGILPRKARPMVASAWPTTLLVRFGGATSGRSMATLAFRPVKSEAGRAAVEINWESGGEAPPRSYTGTCNYTQGVEAEREYRELLKS